MFSIVAESVNTKVIVLTRRHYSFLSDEVITQMKKLLLSSIEIDCPKDLNADQLDKDFSQWQKYKQDLMENIHKNHYAEKFRRYILYANR